MRLNLKKPNFRTLGHIVLFAGVGVLLATNAYLLYGMQNQSQSEGKAAAEAARPAEIRLTVLTAPDCKECFDASQLTSALRANDQVKIADEQLIEYTSDEGAALVQKYNVTRVPTVLIAGDVSKIFDADSFIQNLGRQAEDGTLVVTNVPAPYVEVASGAVKGRFTLTYLTDKQCSECYDPKLHLTALSRLAMKPSEEKTVDRTDPDGRQLITEYKIESTPTILLSGELAEYPQFGQIWASVGTVETDGTYVFRAGQPLMGAYYDVKAKKVVKPELVSQETLSPEQ